MTEAFKPCPFCGGTDIRCTNHGKVSRDPMHRDDDVWSMCCYACGARFPNRYRRELLVEAWNRRDGVHDQATLDSLHNSFGYRPDEAGGERWIVFQDHTMIVVHPERRPRLYDRGGGGRYIEIEPHL